MNESLRVLKDRFKDNYDELRKSIKSPNGHTHHELDLLDEIVLVHNEMITEFVDLLDRLEHEYLCNLETIRYITNITSRLKEE